MAIAEKIGPYTVLESGLIIKEKKKVEIQVPEEILTPFPKFPTSENEADLLKWICLYKEAEEMRSIQTYRYMKIQRAKLRKVAFRYYGQVLRELLLPKTRD